MTYTDADLQSVQAKMANLELTDGETEALTRLLDEAINGDVSGFKGLCNNENITELMSVESHFSNGTVSQSQFPSAMAGALQDLSAGLQPPHLP